MGVTLPEIVYIRDTHLGDYLGVITMKEGEFVLDKAEGDKLILVSKHSTPACDWVLEDGKTVWDYNSRYDYCEPSDPVCKCIYLASSPFEPLGMTTRERANDLQDRDTTDIEYHYPITRLEKYN